MIDYKQFEEFKQSIHKLDKGREEFIQSCVKELSARLLAKVIKRTPVGVYNDGRVGGTLRRGWTAGENTEVKQRGDKYVITISNPVEYAPYVEFGHRTKNHNGWVNGKFMLTISVAEINNIAPTLLKKKLEDWLREVID